MNRVITIPELALRIRGVPPPVVQEALRLLPAMLAGRIRPRSTPPARTPPGPLAVAPDVTPRDLAARIADAVSWQLGAEAGQEG